MNCGNIAIVGRPNVGKSTLLNQFLGSKISITSRKPNTTRNSILGVLTAERNQLVFIDTPGWQIQPKKQLNKNMNREVKFALNEIDCILMLTDARRWVPEDDAIVSLIRDANVRIILALNKEDLISNKSRLLEKIDGIRNTHDIFEDYFIISAQKRKGLDRLIDKLTKLCPTRPFAYPADILTNRTERFLVSELVREKLIRFLGAELPYETKVSIEKFEENPRVTIIDCTVWVEKESQKPIVLGSKGSLIKKIGTEARKDIERLLDKKVYIAVRVKRKRGWSSNPSPLESVGFEE